MKFDPLSLTFAFWTLRAWLGLRTLLSGLEKFSAKISVQQPLLDEKGNPDPSGAVVEVSQKVYGFSHYQAIPDSLKDKFAGEPLLLSIFTVPFYLTLGYILIILGVLLLIGVRTRETLLAMGLLYCVLTVGLILIGQEGGVAWLGIHVIMVAGALVLAPFNRLTITKV